MIKLLAALFFAAVFSANADTQPRGADRLRELVVFPEMNVNFNFGMGLYGNDWMIATDADSSGEISHIREELKKRPDDIQQFLRLGYLLDSTGQTNESKSCYEKIEQLCRDKVAVNPQDGLNLTDLGEALWQLDKNDEAESVFRNATLVSSNEWRCWVRRGNFLADEWILLFPENLRGKTGAFFGQMPSQEILDYRPSADALEKSENSLAEASQCYARAISLAPKESEVFFQYAGYLSVSNRQNCFFRHYRENESIVPTSWLLAFFSKDAIANLKKAAELSPQHFEYISLAAYFEYLNAETQANVANFTSDLMPDASRRFIRDAMSRLEDLSQSPDKKLAAGALESLGILNMFFGNYQVATANLRQAVLFDPTREQSWDMLVGSLIKSGSPEEIVAVCEARLKQKDSARNHLLLARAFQYQKKWDKAGEQAEAALIMDSNNVVANLELLALAIRQSADTNFMAKASEQFTPTQAAYEKLPYSTEQQTRWREWTLNVAILYGLVNTPDYSKAANAWVDAVLKENPNDKQAKEISNALK